MTKYQVLFFVVPLVLLSHCQSYDCSKLNDCDIIFQTSNSTQSRAVQLATHSKYSHMGIIVRQGNELFVYEAMQPVKLTPLSKWIAHGVGRHFIVKRLRDAGTLLAPEAIERLHSAEKKYLGRNYDIYFQWSDERMYCFEVVWKVYKTALNVELG